MSVGIKSSVKRIREILSGNIGYFSAAFSVTVVAGSMISLVDKYFISFPEYISNTVLIAILVVALFITPTLSHGLAYLSAKSRGVEEIRQNPTRLKKSLFAAFGVSWASIGVLLISFLLLPDLNLVKVLCSIAVILSWWLMCRIMISYVKGIWKHTPK